MEDEEKQPDLKETAERKDFTDGETGEPIRAKLIHVEVYKPVEGQPAIEASARIITDEKGA
jgi:hypothetical protein